MREWIANGTELAWLIEPQRQVVEMYRPGTSKPDVLDGVTSVHGEGPVAGFVLELTPIWNPAWPSAHSRLPREALLYPDAQGDT